MSATTTIHLLAQLFTLDCVSCIFLGMIGADVEGGILPRRCGNVENGSDEVTYDGHEGVNQSDTVTIPAIAPSQPIHTRVIASADPHAIRSTGVHTLAI